MASMSFPPIEIESLEDTDGLIKAQSQRERFDRNTAWLQEHIADIYNQYRGKFICVAGQELFVADTAQEVIALAESAHPDDDGRFTRYIPKEKLARIYAH